MDPSNSLNMHSKKYFPSRCCYSCFPRGRQQRIEEEKHILQEYAELLEKQEARRKANKPKIREQSPVAPTPRRRKGEELYYDEDGELWGLWGLCA